MSQLKAQQDDNLPIGPPRSGMPGVGVPSIETMASGNLSLTISADTAWDTRPAQAPAFVRRFGGSALKWIDTLVDQVRIVLVGWRPFFLAFEDFPLRRTLDSRHRACGSAMHDLYEKRLPGAPSRQAG